MSIFNIYLSVLLQFSTYNLLPAPLSTLMMTNKTKDTVAMGHFSCHSADIVQTVKFELVGLLGQVAGEGGKILLSLDYPGPCHRVISLNKV